MDVVYRFVAEMLVDRGLFPDAKEVFAGLRGKEEAELSGPSSLVLLKVYQDTVRSTSKVPGLGAFLERQADVRLLLLRGVTEKVYNEIRETSPNTEVFRLFEMTINPSRNLLTPRHEKLSTDEKDSLARVVLLRDLPKLEETDPMARYLGLREGDVVRVLRPSVASGYSLTYRLVVRCSLERLFPRL